MKKELIIGVLVIAAAAVALYVFRGPSGSEFSQDTIIRDKPHSSEKAVAKKKLAPAAKPDPGKISATSETEQQKISVQEEEPQRITEEEIKDIEGLVKIIDDPDKPIAKVNDVEVSLNNVLPPGYLEPGQPMAEAGYNSFLDMAIDRELVLQKAMEMDVMESEELQAMKNNLQEALAGTIKRSSKEEVDWQVDYMITSALVNKVYEKEGLMPPRITEQDVEQHYNSRSVDYNWLRERERVKGTSEDKIEKLVRKQIQRDLRAPLAQESQRKQREYLDSLREQSNIEYLSKEKP